MKIILATTISPFVAGGDVFMVDWLAEMLRCGGHTVDVFKIPFRSNYPEALEQMFALRLMDISEHGDRLIAIRTPSYLLRHPNKILWFIHHLRGAYDLWGTPYQDIPATPEGEGYRDAIIAADNMAFREARRIYTNSRTVSGRLRTFNNVASEVLYPPLMKPERYRAEGYGDYILYTSRLVSHKRQDLAVKSMRYVRTPVKLVVAGRAAEPGYETGLRELIGRYGLENRVSLLAGWLPEEEKVRLFAQCLAAIYIPFDEDSYGYCSLEAHHAAKAVITASDSGGTLELIADGENGFVCEPEPRAIAAAMDRLWADRKRAREMGEAGRQRVFALGITWENVLGRLTS